MNSDVGATGSRRPPPAGGDSAITPIDLLFRRFSLEAILQWELANSVPGNIIVAAVEEVESPAKVQEPAKRWYEIVREKAGEQYDSASLPEQLSLLLAKSPPFRPFVPDLLSGTKPASACRTR
jgi:hypothetical protein